MRPVCLIIRDGWGYSDISEGNAVLAARTPNNDLYRAKYPRTLLDCAGEPVGLPDGYQGSSEVGHLNMGAGRIVTQELKRIDDGLRTGSSFAGRHGKSWSIIGKNTGVVSISLACSRMRECMPIRSTSSRSCGGHGWNTPRDGSSFILSWTAATRRRGAVLNIWQN